MCESAIMAGTTMDIRIGTQVITAIMEGSTATGIIATAVGIIIEEVEEVTTTHGFLGARKEAERRLVPGSRTEELDSTGMKIVNATRDLQFLLADTLA
jgi:hypothetical protein